MSPPEHAILYKKLKHFLQEGDTSLPIAFFSSGAVAVLQQSVLEFDSQLLRIFYSKGLKCHM